MRNKLLIGLSLIALSTISRGVHATQFGVQAGVNVASASIVNALGAAVSGGSTTQFMGGVFLETSGTLFHLQPELLYIDKGGVQYLALPIFLKVKLPLGPINPFLMAGPEVALKLGGAGSAGAKTIDFGIDIGGGVEFALAPTLAIHVTARYALGIVDTSSAPAPSSFKTRGVHLMGGLSFGF